MKVDILEALLASAVLYGVGSYLFWLNKKVITDTADAVFGHFQRQGAEDEIRRMEEDEDKDEDEDLPCRVLRVQVIDDVGKKCH